MAASLAAVATRGDWWRPAETGGGGGRFGGGGGDELDLAAEVVDDDSPLAVVVVPPAIVRDLVDIRIYTDKQAGMWRWQLQLHACTRACSIFTRGRSARGAHHASKMNSSRVQDLPPELLLRIALACGNWRLSVVCCGWREGLLCLPRLVWLPAACTDDTTRTEVPRLHKAQIVVLQALSRQASSCL